MHWVYHAVEQGLLRWGYWAVLCGLLGEDAGLPLPGETVLMFASFLSHKHQGLELEWVILVGIAAATMGDNLGFLLGRKLGDRFIHLLRKLGHMDDEDVGAAKVQMRRHGKATVFWARYIFGLRTLAGPLAGVLGMEWKEFLLYNLLGAMTWVTTMAMVGFLFASEFQNLLGFFEKVSWAMAAALLTIGYLLWRRQKKRYKARLRRQRGEAGG
jgi:membrane protein DedA with SNARE-associated domain